MGANPLSLADSISWDYVVDYHDGLWRESLHCIKGSGVLKTLMPRIVHAEGLYIEAGPSPDCCLDYCGLAFGRVTVVKSVKYV